MKEEWIGGGNRVCVGGLVGEEGGETVAYIQNKLIDLLRIIFKNNKKSEFILPLASERAHNFQNNSW